MPPLRVSQARTRPCARTPLPRATYIQLLWSLVWLHTASPLPMPPSRPLALPFAATGAPLPGGAYRTPPRNLISPPPLRPAPMSPRALFAPPPFSPLLFAPPPCFHSFPSPTPTPFGPRHARHAATGTRAPTAWAQRMHARCPSPAPHRPTSHPPTPAQPELRHDLLSPQSALRLVRHAASHTRPPKKMSSTM